MNANTIIFACSGASDVGEIADRAARKLRSEGTGKMHCMTAVGAGVESFLKFYRQSTDPILAIDGCALNCATNCVSKAGLSVSHSVNLEALGFKKGETPVTDERITQVAQAARQMMNGGP
ncbi:MAG TPA: putative zinc-binding protein [Rhizomicrobium sp.]|nr:putative zinc-binding protein [Rhizomicrobium sp.]